MAERLRRAAARRDRLRRPASTLPARGLVEAASLAAALGWPVLAEPTSGLRCGPHDRSHVVAHYDVLLRSERFAAEHAPGLVLRVGDTPTSKPLRAWLARAPQIVLDPHAAWHEPDARRGAAAAGRSGRDADGAGDSVWPVAQDGSWLDAWRDGRRARRSGARRGARPVRAEGAGGARAGAGRRRARLGQLLDADPRRRDVLPAVGQAPALPGQPRRQRHRRRGLLGARARRSPPASRSPC